MLQTHKQDQCDEYLDSMNHNKNSKLIFNLKKCLLKKTCHSSYSWTQWTNYFIKGKNGGIHRISRETIHYLPWPAYP